MGGNPSNSYPAPPRPSRVDRLKERVETHLIDHSERERRSLFSVVEY